MFRISSSTGGDRLHRRVGWILAWQIWTCKDEDLFGQQRYHEALTPTMEGHAVTVTDNHRHLGVVLSEDLKWSKHAQCIMAAASKRAGLPRLMARDLPLPVASILYVYYLRPVLEYASPLWHGSLSLKSTQCPWNGYRPVLRVVFSKLAGLHQKRNFSDSSAGQHLDGDGK